MQSIDAHDSQCEPPANFSSSEGSIRVLTTERQLYASMMLLEKMYVDAGLACKRPSAATPLMLPCHPSELLYYSTTFGYFHGSFLQGRVTAVPECNEHACRLPCSEEPEFGGTIEEYSQRYQRIAEVTGFASAINKSLVGMRLIKAVVEHLLNTVRVDVAFIVVHPDYVRVHTGMNRRAGLWVDNCGNVENYKRVGQPGTLLAARRPDGMEPDVSSLPMDISNGRPIQQILPGCMPALVPPQYLFRCTDDGVDLGS